MLLASTSYFVLHAQFVRGCNSRSFAASFGLCSPLGRQALSDALCSPMYLPLNPKTYTLVSAECIQLKSAGLVVRGA